MRGCAHVRRMRPVLSSLLLAATLACSAEQSAAPALDTWLTGAEPERSDLLLVTIDTLRADRIGVYGNDAARTPTMDALARAGTRFEHARTPLPRTTPALASLMTGLWPHHHGAREVWEDVEHGTRLATVLQGQGYLTLGVSASRAASDQQGFGQGFDELLLQTESEHGGGEGASVTDAALELLARREADSTGPLFLWVHYMDPHYPYSPPGSYGPSEGKNCRELAGMYKRRGQIFVNRDGSAEKALGDCLSLYDAEVAYIDGELGRLLEGVASARAGRQGVVVLTSDHGENFGEDGLFYQHGPSLNEASLRIPLIVAGPGLRAGAIDTRSSRLEDLAPTLLSLLGVPKASQPDFDGANLSARLRKGGSAAEAPNPPAFAESGGALMFDFHPALVSGRDRTGYCINGDRFSFCWRKDGKDFLFDRQSDPGLDRDVGDAFPEERERLLAARDRWGPERPRRHSVSVGRFKLEERPRLEGGYDRVLYDLSASKGEARDVSAAHPAEFERLARLLDEWTGELPGVRDRVLSPSDEAGLRALGYVE